MTDQYLMIKDGAKMNVTVDKYEEYLANGWSVLKTPDENKHVVVEEPANSDQQLADSPAVSTETEPTKTAPVSVEEAFERIEKKARSKKKG